MSSFQGYLTYMEYGLGDEKGGAGGFVPEESRFAGDPTAEAYRMFGEDEFKTVTQNPFVYAPMSEERMEYTGERVIESVVDETGAVNWKKPLWADQFKMLKHNAFTGVSVLNAAVDAQGNPVDHFRGLDIRDGFNHAGPEIADFKFLKADGSVAGYVKAVPNADGTIADVTVPADAVKVLYIYNNQVIPQEKLPTVRAHMRGISLEAKARRIAIAYSQFAAFQAKTDSTFPGSLIQ